MDFQNNSDPVFPILQSDEKLFIICFTWELWTPKILNLVLTPSGFFFLGVHRMYPIGVYGLQMIFP